MFNKFLYAIQILAFDRKLKIDIYMEKNKISKTKNVYYRKI